MSLRFIRRQLGCTSEGEDLSVTAGGVVQDHGEGFLHGDHGVGGLSGPVGYPGVIHATCTVLLVT